MLNNVWKYLWSLIWGATGFAALMVHYAFNSSAVRAFPEFNPDVLLHLRRISQIVASGKLLPINGLDPYSGLLSPLHYPYAPLLDLLCIHFCWLWYGLFPESRIPVDEIAGVIPPLLGGLFIMVFAWWLRELKASWTLNAVILFALLQFSGFHHIFGYHTVDHHCLESFFLWIWLMVTTTALLRDADSTVLLACATVCVSGLAWGWNGSPIPVALISAYIVVIMFAGVAWADPLCEFAGLSFFIGGGLVWAKYHVAGAEYTLTKFSPIFPGVVSLAGIALLTTRHCLKVGLKRELLVVSSVSTLLGLWHWGRTIAEQLSYLFYPHPLFSTIMELKPLIMIPDSWLMGGVIDAIGLPFLVIPCAVLLSWRRFGGGKLWLIHHCGIGVFLLSLSGVRFLRWIGFFYALWIGVIFYELIRLVWEVVTKMSARRRVYVASLALLPVIFGMTTRCFEQNNVNFGIRETEFVSAMEWMRRNTPDPGGFADTRDPAYGVLSFWDYGNAVAFFAQRPPITSNLQRGLEPMARFFAAATDTVAFEIAQKNRARYVVVDSWEPENYEKVIPQLLVSRFHDDGTLNATANRDAIASATPLKPQETMHWRLFQDLGMGLKSKTPLKHFYLRYLSRVVDERGYPALSIFEVVQGTRIVGRTEPLASGVCSLAIQLPRFSRNYELRIPFAADNHGQFSVHVSHPTGVYTGGVRYGDLYRVRIGSESRLIGKVQVTEEDLRLGRMIELVDNGR